MQNTSKTKESCTGALALRQGKIIEAKIPVAPEAVEAAQASMSSMVHHYSPLERLDNHLADYI